MKGKIHWCENCYHSWWGKKLTFEWIYSCDVNKLAACGFTEFQINLCVSYYLLIKLIWLERRVKSYWVEILEVSGGRRVSDVMENPGEVFN